jgi:hypothetical protein
MSKEKRSKVRAAVERYLLAPNGTPEAEEARRELMELGQVTTMLELLDTIAELEARAAAEHAEAA